MEDEIMAALRARIESRVRQEALPQIKERVERIVEEEVASVAISLSSYVCFKTLSDRVVIEVHNKPFGVSVDPADSGKEGR